MMVSQDIMHNFVCLEGDNNGNGWMLANITDTRIKP